MYTLAQQLFGALRGKSFVVGGCSPPKPTDVARGTAGFSGFNGCFLLADVWRSFVAVGLSSGASGVLAGDPCKAKVKPAHPAVPVQRSTSCCGGAPPIPVASSNPHTEQILQAGSDFFML